MNKKEVNLKVAELLKSGMSKTEVFNELIAKGSTDKEVAYSIASHPDFNLYEMHYKKVNGIITIMFIQALLMGGLGYLTGLNIDTVAAFALATLFASFALLFAYGFYRNKIWAYNVYILLSIASSYQLFKDFSATPISSTISVILSVSIVGFIWYVRLKLFPDFNGLMTPVKIKGKFVFSD